METTHPISQKIADTDQALEIFDPITYNKGAAVLRQLMTLVSEDAFFKSLQKYF